MLFSKRGVTDIWHSSELFIDSLWRKNESETVLSLMDESCVLLSVLFSPRLGLTLPIFAVCLDLLLLFLVINSCFFGTPCVTKL